jgi:hypothetical protein
MKIGDKVKTTDEEEYQGVVTGFERGFAVVRLASGETLREESDLQPACNNLKEILR